MDEWLKKITDWFLDLAKGIFQALIDFVHDAVLWVFEGILNAVAYLLSLLPAPEFIQQYSFSTLLSGLPSNALYVLGHLRLAEALTVISAAVGFRLLRKLLTLGQW